MVGLCNFVNVTYVLDESALMFYNYPVSKTIEPKEISGKEVLRAICEMNCAYGVIDESGALKIVQPTRTTVETYTKSLWEMDKLEYEDYTVDNFDRVVIRQENNDVGGSYGDGDNAYIIQPTTFFVMAGMIFV